MLPTWIIINFLVPRSPHQTFDHVNETIRFASLMVFYIKLSMSMFTYTCKKHGQKASPTTKENCR